MRRKQHRRMLFPIGLVPFHRIREWKCFDADTGIGSAREIREYYMPDFSNWKDHAEYSRMFERLVRDITARPGDKPESQPESWPPATAVALSSLTGMANQKPVDFGEGRRGVECVA